MHTEKTIGILGGMGPEATSNCFGKVIKNTPAASDQEHLKVVVLNNPKVPDRTLAIQRRDTAPLLSALLEGIDSLKRAGADFVIMPCVTAHYVIDNLKKQSALKVISILDAVADHIGRHHPQLKTVGLLGTDGTVQSRIFQNRLAAEGIQTHVCSRSFQSKVMAAIYDIKNEHPPRGKAEITKDLVKSADHLVEHGAQGIIAGCTEIPLALSQGDITNVPYFDSLLILARTAIRHAGREPV
jgi:aspartate racemase